MAVASIVVCLLFLAVRVEGEIFVGAMGGEVICSQGKFPFTQNSGMALENISYPSKIIKQFRDVESSEECRSRCCDFPDCNVASFISLNDIKVCAIVMCVDGLSCFWQSYELGVASFVQRTFGSATTQTEPTTTTMMHTTTTTPEAATLSATTPGSWVDAWWLNPFNWGKPQKDYPDEGATEKPETETEPNANTLDEALGIDNNSGPNAGDATYFNASDNKVTSAPSQAPILNNNSGDDTSIPKLDDVVSNNVSEVANNDVENNDVSSNGGDNNDISNNGGDIYNGVDNNYFGHTELPSSTVNVKQPADGVKSDEMATSWSGGEPYEMPEEDNTTYTVGLAVFLASLGLAGVLVLTIHFISKNRSKSRYHLVQVEEDMHGDKQPFLPK